MFQNTRAHVRNGTSRAGVSLSHKKSWGFVLLSSVFYDFSLKFCDKIPMTDPGLKILSRDLILDQYLIRRSLTVFNHNKSSLSK